MIFWRTLYSVIPDIQTKVTTVKEEIPVDYHYNGEFSPIRLLQDIENRLLGSDDGTGSVSQ